MQAPPNLGISGMPPPKRRAPERGLMANDGPRKLLINRMLRQMEALGLNARETSLKAGLGETGVYDIINHKNKKPSLVVIQAVAKVLECDVAYLAGEIDAPRRVSTDDVIADIPVAGMAEAGAFRTMVDFDPGNPAGLRVVAARKSRRHPTAKHFALDVRGDSMNAAVPRPIPDGAIVLCVDMISAELEVESGQIYAVRRTLDGGQTWECTVKRARVFRDRYELVPESTNASHEVFVIPRGAGREDEVRQIEAIGLVYGVFFDFEA